MTHVWKVVGSNPGEVYWVDIFHIDLLQKLYCLFEKTEKEAGIGPFFVFKTLPKHTFIGFFL